MTDILGASNRIWGVRELSIVKESESKFGQNKHERLALGLAIDLETKLKLGTPMPLCALINSNDSPVITLN